MNLFLISFLVAACLGGWAFSKLGQRTGHGNAKSAVIGAVVVSVVAFIVIFTVAKMFLPDGS